jgi:3-methyladenine DNA glycosylase AlkD
LNRKVKDMDILKRVRSQLAQSADDKTKEGSKRFFKEEIKVYGVKSAIVDKIAKEGFKHIKDKSKKEIFELCEAFWQSGYMEESFIACNWSYSLSKSFESSDFATFENWVKKYVSNWASCDTFCNHTVGEFVMKYPTYINNLKQWAHSKNRWMKRASAVSLIIPARKGYFLKDIFEIADILLMDPDDMVQKGYGWMLKAASQAHQKEVYNYVLKYKDVMPRTSLRYAIEKLPENLRKLAMQK